MATDRTMSTTWHGTLMDGSGTIHEAGSGAFGPLEVSWASRAEAPNGKTSPEELLAAAHGGCFTTSLAGELTKAGTPPERLEVRCTITMDEVEGKGHQIVHSQIVAHGTVPDCDEAAFAQAAEAADAGCPFSALIRASATVAVTASLS